MSKRIYGQACPAARALDVLGERWTILIVRELLLGPKRFRDLLAVLPAMGTNRLADRLGTLQDTGVLTRRLLPEEPSGEVRAYELTAFGEELRPLVALLFAWGVNLPTADGVDPEFERAELMALCITSTAPSNVGAGLHETYEFQVGAESFHVVVDDGRIRTRSGHASMPTCLAVECDLPTFSGLAAGTLSPQRALDAGLVRMRGDQVLLDRAFRILHWPEVRAESGAGLSERLN